MPLEGERECGRVCVEGEEGEPRTPSRDFLPLDKNNSAPLSGPLRLSPPPPRQSVSDPVTAPIFSLTPSQQLPAWPGVAVLIRIASLMLN